MKRTPFKKKKTHKKLGKSKRLTIPRLRDKAWRVFSKYIRTKDSIGGYVKCITCGEINLIEDTHAGHFYHGKNKSTYFLEENVHPQCPRCNMYLSGNLIEYTLYMINEYGEAYIDQLRAWHEKSHVWKREVLENLLHTYTEKLKKLTPINKEE